MMFNSQAEIFTRCSSRPVPGRLTELWSTCLIPTGHYSIKLLVVSFGNAVRPSSILCFAGWEAESLDSGDWSPKLKCALPRGSSHFSKIISHVWGACSARTPRMSSRGSSSQLLSRLVENSCSLYRYWVLSKTVGHCWGAPSQQLLSHHQQCRESSRSPRCSPSRFCKRSKREWSICGLFTAEKKNKVIYDVAINDWLISTNENHSWFSFSHNEDFFVKYMTLKGERWWRSTYLSIHMSVIKKADICRFEVSHCTLCLLRTWRSQAAIEISFCWSGCACATSNINFKTKKKKEGGEF